MSQPNPPVVAHDPMVQISYPFQEAMSRIGWILFFAMLFYEFLKLLVAHPIQIPAKPDQDTSTSVITGTPLPRPTPIAESDATIPMPTGIVPWENVDQLSGLWRIRHHRWDTDREILIQPASQKMAAKYGIRRPAYQYEVRNLNDRLGFSQRNLIVWSDSAAAWCLAGHVPISWDSNDCIVINTFLYDRVPNYPWDTDIIELN